MIIGAQGGAAKEHHRIGSSSISADCEPSRERDADRVRTQPQPPTLRRAAVQKRARRCICHPAQNVVEGARVRRCGSASVRHSARARRRAHGHGHERLSSTRLSPAESTYLHVRAGTSSLGASRSRTAPKKPGPTRHWSQRTFMCERALVEHVDGLAHARPVKRSAAVQRPLRRSQRADDPRSRGRT